MEMKEYLESHHWENVKRKAINRDNNLCIDCGADWRIEVHHLRYPDAFYKKGKKYINITEDRPGNLVTLCNNCHNRRHGYLQKNLSRNEDSYIYTLGRREKKVRPLDFRDITFRDIGDEYNNDEDSEN